MIEGNQQRSKRRGPICNQRENHQRGRQRRRAVGRRAMGSQGRTGRPDRRYSVSLPAGGTKRAGRKAVPDFQSERKSRTVPVLRTVSRRSRFQGASGERAFQDLYRRRSVAVARQTRTRAIRVTVRSAMAKGPTICVLWPHLSRPWTAPLKTAEARGKRACRRGRVRGQARRSGAGSETPCRG